MTNHRVEAFVDAILADRPPKRFSATPDDADLLRLAIELHVSRSEKIEPDPQFVRELGGQLAAADPGDARIVPFAPGPRPAGVRGHPWCPVYGRLRAGLPVDASAPSVPRLPPWSWWLARSPPPIWYRLRRELPWRFKVPLPSPRSALAPS